MKKSFIITVIVTCAILISTAGELPLGFGKKLESPLKPKKSMILADDGPSERTSKSVIKFNISQLIFKNLSLQYEFGFHKNFSAAVGFSYLVPRNIPTLVFKPDDTYGYQLPNFGGWAVTPEFRIYPGKKEEHQAPHGFYIAPYFRYASYTLKADYIDSTYNPAHLSPAPLTKYKVSATYAGFTGGLMIGAQWIINKHFSFDWWILGGGAGMANFTIKANAVDPINMNQQDQDNLKNDINTNLGYLKRFSNGTVDIQTTANSAQVTIKGIPMTSYRAFGFCLGYAF